MEEVVIAQYSLLVAHSQCGASWTLMTWEAAPSNVSKGAGEGDNWHARPSTLQPLSGEAVSVPFHR